MTQIVAELRISSYLDY